MRGKKGHMANVKSPELHNYSSGDKFSEWKQGFAWLTDLDIQFLFYAPVMPIQIRSMLELAIIINISCEIC